MAANARRFGQALRIWRRRNGMRQRSVDQVNASPSEGWRRFVLHEMVHHHRDAEQQLEATAVERPTT